ncbi:hypothetical protein [Streptomyces turgidiscabies]|uniref:Uncharacterized protein n=1 Tax=Streptomyces turgidiscabies TaxID=85558 RepID=A0ABU0RTT5_9ACTN|nr:hypothetical protein [Streptomyces turgidiscabies]MDQ0935410.1 hypothetical protein [Streptomyces turgidiscabies]
MAVEVERHRRVVVDDIVHGEFKQSGVLQPEEERQGASRTNIERQSIVAETPVQLFGLLLVRGEDAGCGDASPGNYKLANKATTSRPGDEGTHLTTFYSPFLQPHLKFWLCELLQSDAVLVEPVEQFQGPAQSRSHLVLRAGA